MRTLDSSAVDQVVRVRCLAVVFRNPASNYIIFRAAVLDDVPALKGAGDISVLGTFADVAEGAAYECRGRLVPNEKYGRGKMDLRVSSYRTILPDDLRGIKFYLVYTAKWVGPATADEITRAFGEDALNVIRDNPDRVAAEIKGITPARALEMAESLRQAAALESATIELARMIGELVKPSTLVHAIKRWGAAAPAIVNRNPYRLTELSGVAWPTADQVYRGMGRSLCSFRRTVAAIEYQLRERHFGDGDTLVLVEDLRADLTKLLGPNIHPAGIEGAVRAGVAKRVICTRKIMSSKFQVEKVGLTEIVEAEEFIGGWFRQAVAGRTAWIDVPVDGLSGDQIAAATLFAASNVAVICGAPGTGKTYTVARCIRPFLKAKVAIAAPTGKAAKAAAAALDKAGVVPPEAPMTIHRLLGAQKTPDGGWEFEHYHGNPLDLDLLVVDEFSMVDVPLLRSLLDAINPARTRLLIVGDHYQLPSVGPGAILRDLVETRCVRHNELTEIKRNAGDIVQACHRIKDGRMPEHCTAMTAGALPEWYPEENWWHWELSESNEIRAAMCEQYLSLPRQPQFKHLSALLDIQTVAPLNERGDLSVDAINSLLRPIVVAEAKELGEKAAYGDGDKIVRLRNGFVPDDKGNEDSVYLVNGDLGVVAGIDPKGTKALIKWTAPDRLTVLNIATSHCKLAYALTVHKMQGSEIPIVIFPLDAQFAKSPVFNRELIYTAFSRAKVLLVTIGQMSVLKSGISRKGNSRSTRLPQLLSQAES